MVGDGKPELGGSYVGFCGRRQHICQVCGGECGAAGQGQVPRQWWHKPAPRQPRVRLGSTRSTSPVADVKLLLRGIEVKCGCSTQDE